MFATGVALLQTDSSTVGAGTGGCNGTEGAITNKASVGEGTSTDEGEITGDIAELEEGEISGVSSSISEVIGEGASARGMSGVCEGAGAKRAAGGGGGGGKVIGGGGGANGDSGGGGGGGSTHSCVLASHCLTPIDVPSKKFTRPPPPKTNSLCILILNKIVI